MKTTKNQSATEEQLYADYGPGEELLEKTKAYPMVNVRVCATKEFETVPDILTGGKRKRKYGAVISMAAIPDFEKQQEPVMVMQDIPMLLIDGDTIDELEERVVAEVRSMMKITKDTLDGKIVPPSQEDNA